MDGKPILLDATTTDEGSSFLNGHQSVSLCLVSRRFCKEYREQVERNGLGLTIDLWKWAGAEPRFKSIISTSQLSSLLPKVRHVTAYYYDQYDSIRLWSKSNRLTEVETRTDISTDVAEQHQKLSDVYLKALPQVQSLDIVLRVYQHGPTSRAHVDETRLSNSDDINKQFFSLPLLFPDTDRWIWLRCQLFAIHRDAGKTKYRSGLERSSANYINYHATPSERPDSWRGLALEVEESGIWAEFETWKLAFDAGWRAATED